MGLFSIRKTNTVFYNSGEIEIVYQTLNNQLDGWHKIYHKNGQLKTIVNYKKDLQIDEKVKSYDEKGNLVRIVEIKNNELNGSFKEFYSSGKLRCEGFYNDGQILEKKEYFENSSIKYHFVKSKNNDISKVFQNDISFLKNNLEMLPKFSIIYSGNNDLEFYLYDSYEAASNKFKILSEDIFEISKKYKVEEINNKDFIEIVELCEIKEINCDSILSIEAVKNANELKDIWIEIISDSSYRHLTKFTSLINGVIKLNEYEGKVYLNSIDINRKQVYFPVENIFLANSVQKDCSEQLKSFLQNIKNERNERIEKEIEAKLLTNFYHIVDLNVAYLELTDSSNDIVKIDNLDEQTKHKVFEEIISHLIENQIIFQGEHSKIVSAYQSIFNILETEARFFPKTDDEIITYYNIFNRLFLVDEFLKLLKKNELKSILYVSKIQVKNVFSDLSIHGRINKIEELISKGNVDFSYVELVFRSIINDIESNNLGVGKIENQIYYEIVNSEELELKLENIYYDLIQYLNLQNKLIPIIICCEKFISKFPNSKNTRVYQIIGTSYLELHMYDKAILNYNTSIQFLLNNNNEHLMPPDFDVFYNRAACIYKLNNQSAFLNEVALDDLEIYLLENPDDKAGKNLHNHYKTNLKLNHTDDIKVIDDNKDLLKHEIPVNNINSDAEIDILNKKSDVISTEKLKKTPSKLDNEKKTEIEEYSDTVVNLITDLIKEGKQEEAFSLFVELNQISIKSEIKNRILNSNIESDDFLKFLSEIKSFIFASTLSENVKIKLLEIITYLENENVFNDNIDKLIDIVFYFENDYNDEIYESFSEINFLEGLQHAEIIKKFLSYFVDESRSSVCDTFAYLLLLNDKLPEAEKEILKCLQIDINSDLEIPVHYITAAKIFYKKNDLINGLKYYEKAIELGADDEQIKDIKNFLIINNIENKS
jgi:hypothetical protein